MTVLCEHCFTDWQDKEVLTIVPLSGCVQCGAHDMRHVFGARCNLFRTDPRKEPTKAERDRKQPDYRPPIERICPTCGIKHTGAFAQCESCGRRGG